MSINILWVDDEIEYLKPYVIFLNSRGYNVEVCNNGLDALKILVDNKIDVVFLDEHMPGLSGIETLIKIKDKYPNIPVVMITKSEEESIMEDAIGSKIDDYLIKPVNPKQIILSLKKIFENKKLVVEKSIITFQQEYRNLVLQMSALNSFEDWVAYYKKLVYWELELDKYKEWNIIESLLNLKSEANNLFCKYVQNNYIGWLKAGNSSPLLSHKIFGNKILPVLDDNKPVYLIVIDNLRYDQWKIIEPIVLELFDMKEEYLYMSILPTTTKYARNAFFSGLMPIDIKDKYPQYWVVDEDESNANKYEEALMLEQLRSKNKNIKSSFYKILNSSYGKKVIDNLPNTMDNKLNVIIFNFVDMLSHARTEIELIKELAENETAYRSVTLSWFDHSPLIEILRFLSDKKVNVIITTDHGSIKVTVPSKISASKEVNSNLRYKEGKNIQYNIKDLWEVRNPSMIGLPQDVFASYFLIIKENKYFVMQHNYNQYVNYYKNSFQHGGISMEEMIIPYVHLISK